MFARGCIVMFVALACAAPLIAQSRGAKPDSLSGTWAGELAVDDRARSITLELKFDGKSKVTGRFTGLPRPGDVKRGTFDPKTGALKLDLGIEGDSAVRLTLEGTVAGDKATGNTSGEATGTFALTRRKSKQ